MDDLTRFSAIYGQRRRQVVVVLVMGIFGVFIAHLTVVHLPSYYQSMTADDGETLHLVAQANPLPKIQPTFFTTHSTDGRAFSQPTTRSGSLAGAAALDGRLYCLLANGSLVKLSADSWTPIAQPQLDWRILGVAVVDNELRAFGQSKDHAKILTATLDNDTWHADVSFDHQGDNIGFIQGVHAAGENHLVWTEFRLPKRASADDNQPAAAATLSDLNAITPRLLIGKVAGDKLDVLASREFGRPFGMSAVGDSSGIHVFLQEISLSPGRRRTFSPRVQVIHFEDGKLRTPMEVKTRRGRWMRMGDFTVGNSDGRTFLYSFDYWFGTLYAGVHGAEVIGDELSEEFMVLAPGIQDVESELTWLIGAIAAGFIATGGLAGLLKLKSLERQKSVLAGRPLYATVTDRAAATALDFTLVYLVMRFGIGGAGLIEFWASFLLAFAAYGAALETTLAGQTLGKRLLGLRVLETTGATPNLGTTIRRNIFKFFEIMTIGVGVCLVTRRFQRPGDFWANTVVVKELQMPRHAEE